MTYCARGLERMRGFDVFMRVAKLIYTRFPDVRFVVVGDDKCYYKDDTPKRAGNGNGGNGGGKRTSYREHVLAQDAYDLSKFHFTGRVPGEQLAQVLGMSDLHVYLTEPFITSWSLLDAMSCGCTILASDQACVREYIKDGENGILADFFDAEGMANRAIEVLTDPPAHRRLGNAARRTILREGYALRDTLPRLETFFADVASTPRSPSMRAELFLRNPAGATPAAAPAAGAETTPLRPPCRDVIYGDAVPFGDEVVSSSDTSAPREALSDVIRPGESAGTPVAAAAAAAVAAMLVSPRGDEGSRCRIADDPQAAESPATRDAGRASPSPLPLSPAYREEGAKRILFCWELGAGLGHVMEIAPLVNAMCERGHRVFAAMRHLTECGKAFDTAAELLPAPYLGEPRAGSVRARPQTRNFADILSTLTFCDDDALLAHADAWRALFELTRPDVLVFDYSPTAMLAARFARPDATKIVIGNGFLIPPDRYPFPALRRAKPDEPDFQERMRADEDVLLHRANRLLRSCGSRELTHLGQLYGEVDLTLMMTMREMDPYAQHRPAGTEYLGAVNATGGATPRWAADGDGPKVYAYLRPLPAMTDVLRYLGERRVPSVIYAPALNDAGRRRFADCKTLRFETERLDLAHAANACDLAILNGNLGTSSAMLLAGKPALHLPEHLEHALNARAVQSLGAGVVAPVKDGGLAVGKLADLLGGGALSGKAGDAARTVAARYRGFSADRQLERIAGSMDGTLAKAA